MSEEQAKERCRRMKRTSEVGSFFNKKYNQVLSYTSLWSGKFKLMDRNYPILTSSETELEYN